MRLSSISAYPSCFCCSYITAVLLGSSAWMNSCRIKWAFSAPHPLHLLRPAATPPALTPACIPLFFHFHFLFYSRLNLRLPGVKAQPTADPPRRHSALTLARTRLQRCVSSSHTQTYFGISCREILVQRSITLQRHLVLGRLIQSLGRHL